MTEQSNELTVKINQEIGLLNWNFDELNRQLDEQLKKYQGLQFSDAEMAEAKKTKAMLNHISKEINDRKISVKKQFCAPYDAFAEQAKQLTTKIDKCAAGIDAQIKSYETAEQEKKRKQIEEYWNSLEEVSKFIPLKSVWDERYLNKTYSESQWKTDLDKKAEQIEKDTDAIVKMPSDQMNYMSVDYIKTLNLGASLANWQNHLDDLERTEELRQKAAADAEARQKAQEERQAQMAQSSIPQQNVSPAQEIEASHEELWAVMEVSGTYEQMVEMTSELKRIGLRFHVKEKGKRTV